MKYLIKKAWLDPMENRNATGYDPIGYVDTKEEAEEIMASGRVFTSNDCWAINYMPNHKMNEFIYQEIPNLNEKLDK